jgi:hypothetical protein
VSDDHQRSEENLYIFGAILIRLLTVRVLVFTACQRVDCRLGDRANAGIKLNQAGARLFSIYRIGL